MWVLLWPERLSDRRIGLFMGIYALWVSACIPTWVRAGWVGDGLNPCVPTVCHRLFVDIPMVSSVVGTVGRSFPFLLGEIKKELITCYQERQNYT